MTECSSVARPSNPPDLVQPTESATLPTADILPILVQPEFVNEHALANVAIKREDGGLILLTDTDNDGGMMVDQVQEAGGDDSVEPDSQPTYYLSNAIGSAFQVCSAVEQENVEPVGSVPALFLLHNGCITAARTVTGIDSEPKLAAQNVNWPTTSSCADVPCNKETSAMYYFALSGNLPFSSTNGLEQTALTSSGTTSHQSSGFSSGTTHLMKVFQQDGIGTVVASIGGLKNDLLDDGGFSMNLNKVSSALVDAGKMEHVLTVETEGQPLSADDGSSRLQTADVDAESRMERFGVESKG